MKLSYLPSTLTLFLPLTLASPTNDLFAQDLLAFESRFLSTLSYTLPPTSPKLIGYKKISIPSSQVPAFEKHYNSHLSNWEALTGTFYHKPTSTLRVYFPVEGALVEHDGKLIEANAQGELDILISEEKKEGYEVIGRYQTPSITGVEDNIIHSGIIHLSSPCFPSHKLDHPTLKSTYIYDFGNKTILSHSHGMDLKAREENKALKNSCMSNHGGPNCSDKFGIHNGRCNRRHDVCVDYNGWFTDCKKGGATEEGEEWNKVTNFPGSDCYSALLKGHCWSEVM